MLNENIVKIADSAKAEIDKLVQALFKANDELQELREIKAKIPDLEILENIDKLIAKAEEYDKFKSLLNKNVE